MRTNTGFGGKHAEIGGIFAGFFSLFHGYACASPPRFRAFRCPDAPRRHNALQGRFSKRHCGRLVKKSSVSRMGGVEGYATVQARARSCGSPLHAAQATKGGRPRHRLEKHPPIPLVRGQTRARNERLHEPLVKNIGSQFLAPRSELTPDKGLLKNPGTLDLSYVADRRERKITPPLRGSR